MHHRGSSLISTERYKLPISSLMGALRPFFSSRTFFNTQWEGATFAFASHLPSEPAGGVQDIHFVPGNPRFFMGGVAWCR